MHIKIVLATLMLIVSHSIRAQYAAQPYRQDSVMADTLSLSNFQKKADNLSQSRLFKSTYIGVPLVIGGLIVKSEDDHFRSLRNDFLPVFKNPTDNYIQYLPAATMVGMKLAGVPSRSSWGRMLVGDALATAMMTAVVQGVKRSANVVRPDGSDHHSFPSGHTATAFMTATMLNKEYGYLSPWVSVGAYTVATATGLMRIANNKHWLSDVMVGAGVGVMSTEFAYWIADMIFKDKGLNIADDKNVFLLEEPKLSFVGMYVGFNAPLSHYDLTGTVSYKTSVGTTAGIEGAHFFNRYFGLGGRLTVSNEQLIVNQQQASDNTLHYFSFYVGPYFNLPLSNRWSLGSKLLAGYTNYSSTDIGGVHVPQHSGWGAGTGLRLNYRMKQHMSISLFTDYNLQHPESSTSNEYVHMLVPGAVLSVNY